MKASSKILIYDDGCPLCSAYTSVFVKAGMLEKEGRKNFNNTDAGTFSLVDKKRCHNEIPLVDTQTNQVWYGIDALLEILSVKIPWIKFLGKIKPVKWLLQELYKFISFNRKVIVAESSFTGYNCNPDFSLRYRAAFMAVFFLFNTIMLVPLHQTIFSNSFINNSSVFQLQAAHFCLVAMNITSALQLNRKEGFEYLGQVNMLALITILLLIPLHYINLLLPGNQNTLNNIYLGLLSICIFRQYIKRMRYAGIFDQHRWIGGINIVSLAAFLIYLVV